MVLESQYDLQDRFEQSSREDSRGHADWKPIIDHTIQKPKAMRIQNIQI